MVKGSLHKKTQKVKKKIDFRGMDKDFKKITF